MQGPEKPDDPDDPGEPSGRDTESESDDDLNINFDDRSLSAHLQCIRNHTVREALVLDLALSIRHLWTYEALIGSFLAKNTIYCYRYFPTSKKALWRVINRNNAGIRQYAYCNQCLTYLGRKSLLPRQVECRCGFSMASDKVKWFVSFSLQKQFQHFLAIPGIAEHLEHRQRRQKMNQDSVEDIFDGQCYKNLQGQGKPLSCVFDFSYVFNTDGFRIMKGSKIRAWPVLIRLNELPPRMRQKFLFLAGLWVDVKDPDMVTFLRPFVSQANRLSTTGLRWRPNGGDEVVSKFVPTCHCVDSGARYKLLNMSQYNGYYGCTYCDHVGVWDGYVRFPIIPHDGIPQPAARTDENIKRDMVQSVESGTVVRGVHGPSELMNLLHHDLADGAASDDLHTIYEGTAKEHTDLLLPLGNTSIEGKCRLIDARLMLIKPPSDIARKPFSFKNRAQWKASEWRNWLLFYSIPCLQGLVPQRYISHLEMFSYAVFLLSQEVIEPRHIDLAEHLLLRYMTHFEEYFGVVNMRYNVHLLSHFASSVRNWGPLWVYSTFNFESWNHRLVKCITSPKGAIDQIVTWHLMKIHVAGAVYDAALSEDVRSTLENILYKARISEARRVGDAYVLGQGFQRLPTAQEALALQREGLVCNELTAYVKVMAGGSQYWVTGVGAERCSDNTTLYTMQDTFCSLRSVVVIRYQEEDICGLFVTEHDVVSPFNHAKHIARMNVDDDGLFHFIRTSSVHCPAVKVRVANYIYITPIPNRHEID